MQTIYQNGQEGIIYLLVPFVELIGQNKMPLFKKTGKAEYKLKFKNP